MMKIIVLSPSAQSDITNLLLSKLNDSKGFQLQSVIYRKIFGIKRLKEQMNLGFGGIVSKILRKWFIPKLKSYSNINSSLKDVEHTVHYVSDFNASGSVELIRSYEPDIVLFTGGGILKKNVLSASKLGVLNCHLGILPFYRGMFPHIWAIYNNDFEEIGCTTHIMDEGIDTGPILSRFYVQPSKYEFNQLTQVLEAMIPDCLISSLQLLNDGKIKYERQKQQDGKLFKVPNEDIKAKARANFQKYKTTLGKKV